MSPSEYRRNAQHALSMAAEYRAEERIDMAERREADAAQYEKTARQLERQLEEWAETLAEREQKEAA